MLQAYPRTRNAAVQIARIAAGTVIAVTFILGFFMLASAYVSATYSCAAYNNLEALRQVCLVYTVWFAGYLNTSSQLFTFNVFKG